MIGPAAILVVDSNASDSALSSLLLARDLPQATVTPVSDALGFAAALTDRPVDVAIVAADLAWAEIADVVASVRMRRPDAGVIIFGHETDILARALNPGLICDGVLRKSSAGFLHLSALLETLLTRASGRAARAATSGASPAAAPAPSPSMAPRTVEAPPQEMRDIALAWSHDLKEPLHQIARLARRGQESKDEQVSARALARVLECANRATVMLDGMLEYLSVATRDATPAPVNLQACIQEAVEQLRSTIEESQAEVTFADLPTILGDAHQLDHLFQNLLSNALKFRGRQRPVVRITASPEGPYWRIAVRDNGIGIPAGFAQRVFEMGQRLHTREEYPGTGIGLALCKRIVERHGGRIWVEPGDGEGTTLSLVLPRMDAGSPIA